MNTPKRRRGARAATAAALASLAVAATGCASQNMAVSANTNQCAHVVWHGALIEGTPVCLLQCIGRRNEYWSIGDGQISGIGGSCLEVMGSAPVDGAGVIAVSCNGSPSQHWTLVGRALPRSNGKCARLGMRPAAAGELDD